MCLGQGPACFGQRAVGAAPGGVRDHATQVVVGGGVGVERIEAVVGTHVAEEVLLAPPAEHQMGDGRRVLVIPGREHLGLVTGGGIPAGDLATDEAVLAAVVGDGHPPVGQQVVVDTPGGIGVHVGVERRDRFGRGGLLAVGEDVEAREPELLEQLGRPPTPVEADGRVGIGAHERADLVGHEPQLADQAGPGGGPPTEDPVAVGITDPGVQLSGHGQADAGHVGLR